MNRRRTAIAAALAVIVALAVFGADRVVDLPEPTSPAAAPVADEAATGAWTCAVGDGRDGSALALTAARVGQPDAGPGTLDLEVFGEGATQARSVPPVFPGAHARTDVELGADAATFARWSGGPLAVSREWRLDEVADVPSGTVAGPCEPTLSDRWTVPGLRTDGGHEARLRAVNPFPTDATIAVGFVTPQGPQEPLALQNLTVPAHGTFELTVNDSMPEQEDLSAVVRVLSGRAVVEGYQLARSAIGGVDGASLLGASTAPAETWTVPWLSDREGDTSWLWVANLGERPAPVELTLHTPDGGVPPAGLSDVTVAPGQVRRVDLRGTFPEGVDAAAVTVRSDGAPVHVSGAVRRTDDDPERTAFVVQLGIPRADHTWVAAGGATAGGHERVDIVNRGSEPARVSVTLFNGSTELRPEELADLDVGPGQSLAVPLSEVLGDVDGWSARVVASEGEVLVGRVGASGGQRRHLIAHPATPRSAWSPDRDPLRPEDAEGMVQRLDTAGGVEASGPSGLPSEPPADPDGAVDAPAAPAD